MYTEQERKKWVLRVALLCGLGGILYGYDIGVISGALLYMEHAITLTQLQVGLVVGAVFFGGLIGTMLAGPVADYFGRRIAIMFACFLFAIGIVLVLGAHGFVSLLLARLLLGAGIGVVAVAVPLYVAELVPASNRGRYVTFFQLFLTFGIVLAYMVDIYFSASANWRAMFGVVLIPATILLFAIARLPESPRWLLRHGRKKDALAVLQRTHSLDEAVHEVSAIYQNLQAGKLGWSDLFGAVRWGILLLAVAVAVLNQGTGINAILQYAPGMLEASGISSHSAALLGALGVGALQFIVTCVAVFVVDRLGRRPLMLVGTTGMLLVNVLLVMVNASHWFGAIGGLLSLLGLLGFIVFYAIGPGVVVWLVISELFPTAVRARGMALCLFFNSLTGSVLTSVFPLLQAHVGIAGVYALCAASSLLYLLVVLYGLPETKSKTLEQIQQHVGR